MVAIGACIGTAMATQAGTATTTVTTSVHDTVNTTATRAGMVLICEDQPQTGMTANLSIFLTYRVTAASLCGGTEALLCCPSAQNE